MIQKCVMAYCLKCYIEDKILRSFTDFSIPNDSVERVDEKMVLFNESFNSGVGNFIEKYNIFIDQAREKLNGLFCQSDYPQNIRDYFSFKWQFVTINPPDEEQLRSQELRRRENEKFEQMINEFGELAVTTLRTSFSDLVNHMVERLSGEKKVFRDTLVTNVREFINDFKSLNIWNDSELAVLTDKCNAILNGVNVNTLRSNDIFRASIAGKLSEVKTQIDGMLVNRPSRLLRAAM